MAPLLLLEGEKLRELAIIIRNQEILAVHNLPFKSEWDHAQYLRDVGDNYNSIIKLLDDANAMKQMFKDDKTRYSIAHDTCSYVQKGVNISLQAVRNYALRTEYLSKIGAHAKDIFEALKTLDPENLTDVADLANEANKYNECMHQIMMKHQSPDSHHFSKWLKDSGTTFEDLVIRYQNQRGLLGLFENLSDAQKLLVYNDIIKASGRGSVINDDLKNMANKTGKVFLVLNCGIMVWDIFTSNHIFEAITKHALMRVADASGVIVKKLVGAVLPTLVGVKAASKVFVLASAVIGSILGVFVIGPFVGWFVSYMFNSGGKYPLSTDGHHCYVASLPDGEAVARQIAHQWHQLTY